MVELLAGSYEYRPDERLAVELGQNGPVAERMCVLCVRVEFYPMPHGTAAAMLEIKRSADVLQTALSSRS